MNEKLAKFQLLHKEITDLLRRLRTSEQTLYTLEIYDSILETINRLKRELLKR